MKRVDLVRKLYDESPFDLHDSKTCARLIGFRTEMRWWCPGSDAYRELHNEILDASRWKLGKYTDGGRYLDLRPFFNLNRDNTVVVERYLTDVKVDELSDEDAYEILASMANYHSMEKYIELLVGFPAYEPKGSLGEIATSNKWGYDKSNYSYVSTVRNADIEIVRETLKWLQERVSKKEKMHL